MAGIQKMAKRAGIDADLAHRFVEAIVTSIMDGERVTLRGLGSFNLKTLPPRTYYTAVMSKPVQKPERDTIAFTPSEKAIERLNQ